MILKRLVLLMCLAMAGFSVREASAQVLDKQKQLDAQTFWDNRDWDWYIEQIPFFECPDAEITTTYYYRWELLTKHLTYGSPNSGYSFTEFIDRPFWSGAYGAISCPAGHQLYEARWLRQPRIARDYLKYWFRTPGAQPRNYSTWLGDSAWAVNQVHRDDAKVIDLLPDLIRNYEGWEQRHFVPEVGLFWQTGHDDGMEFNINSRQTKYILRGAPSYRPSFNAYMWADAVAIAKLARLAGQNEIATRFENKAESLKATMLKLLWDDKRKFFFPVYKNDEERDGHRIKALTRTYESGQFAGDPHGRELIGYVPWQFNMLERSKVHDAAWAKLMDRDGFFSDFGPSTVERNDPMFLLKNSCCWWSGQSWPYATTQTLKALANVLQRDVTESTEGSKSVSRSGAATDADVKAAVTRSLPFLEKQGVAWMEERDCMSCHHVPFLLWSHRAASRHGVTIDDRKLAEWDAWCQKDSLSLRNLYRLQKYELGRIAADKLPMPVRDKLTSIIEKPFPSTGEFIAALKPLLTDDELKLHQDLLVKTAERPLNHPDRAGGGLDVIAYLLLGSHGSSSELAKPEFRSGLIKLMLDLQRPDGSWMPGNQLLSMRRMTVPTADQVTTMWAAKALAVYGDAESSRTEAINKAVAFVRQQVPDLNNREWLATRLLFEKQFGTAIDVEKLRLQLLSDRNSDGGWGWEKDQPSDPLTTGLAIYALARVGGDHSAIFRDARRYLLAAQHADGSWLTPAKSFTKTTDPERLKVRDEIYHYWGTGWAVIGLLETLNVTEAARDSSSPSDDAVAGLPVTQADYVKLLQIYAKSHRKNGKPYLAEALHPDTGSFEGHDGYNHSEHYFHSGFCDLIITGLVGLTPRDDETLEINPLAPASWDYFALDDVPYRGHLISVLWDRTGERYKRGAGLRVLVDGREAGKSDMLQRIAIKHAVPLPSARSTAVRDPRSALTNFAVNNDGDYFPRVTVSHTGPNSSPAKLIDGNYWYHRDPPNRWTSVGSTTATDEVVLDLGMARRVHTAKLYFLDDGEKVVPPREYSLETWRDGRWMPLADQQRSPQMPTGRRANIVRFPEQDVVRLRAVFTHAANGHTGLTEFELWGDATLPISVAGAPQGNLAFRNPNQQDGFPKISASHTSRFDKVEMASDGRTIFTPSPHNRWTAYESKSPADWLEIEFEKETEFRRVDLAIYDDRGGVQPPSSYTIQFWNGSDWSEVTGLKRSPEQPTGSQWNQARFEPVKSKKVRVDFTHKGQSRSGVSELMIWND